MENDMSGVFIWKISIRSLAYPRSRNLFRTLDNILKLSLLANQNTYQIAFS